MKSRLNRVELISYLTKVVLHMDDWRLDSRDQYRIYLRRGDGLSIFVRNSNHTIAENGKLFFVGLLPSEYGGSRTTGRIGISFSRSPYSAARDIVKRLINDFEIEFKKAKESVKNDKQKIEALSIYNGLLKNVGFKSFTKGHGSRNYRREFHATNKNISMTFFISEKASELNLSGLNIDQIIKLAYFIKDL